MTDTRPFIAWNFRLLAPVAIAVMALAIAFLLLGTGNGYQVNVVFQDASQLIPGDLVEVGGVPIGHIVTLKLTDDGLADAVIAVDPGTFRPLHEGTTAGVGTVGLSGIANRFIDLHPGPDNEPLIPDNGTIPVGDTAGVVDIDELLDALTPPVRSDIQASIQGSAKLINGAVKQAHAAAGYAPPALDQATNLLEQLTHDKVAFSDLLGAGAAVAQTLAQHSRQLSGSIDGLAATFSALASERADLRDALARLPAVLPEADRTLTALRSALRQLNPTLVAARPVAAPLAAVLRALVPAATLAVPTIDRVDALVPTLERAITPLPHVDAIAAPTLKDTSSVLRASQPLFAGLRPYVPDIINGFAHGLGGGAAGGYDANGHYVKTILGVSPSVAAQLLGINVPADDFGVRTGLTHSCPGGAGPPATDMSNPFIPVGTVCDRSEDQGR